MGASRYTARKHDQCDHEGKIKTTVTPTEASAVFQPFLSKSRFYHAMTKSSFANAICH